VPDFHGGDFRGQLIEDCGGGVLLSATAYSQI
jgi:hypothetical protein